MSFAAGPGAILIDVTLADGRVCVVEIKSSRPAALGRYFLARAQEEVPLLAERIFALCGFSHRLAAMAAISAAQGRALAAPKIFDAMLGLLAERIGEMLRASLFGWPLAAVAERRIGAAMPFLRQALASVQVLMAAARTNTAHKDRRTLRPIAEQLRQGMDRLGVPRGAKETSAASSFFADLTTDIAGRDAFAFRRPDALCAADDGPIAIALRNGSADFSAFPSLAGRIVETGPFCRHWEEVQDASNALAARLAARLIDLRAAESTLSQMLVHGEADAGTEIVAQRLGDKEAYAAVESPRGRLYHRVALDDHGCIDSYDLLAPTEWNCHPAGPLSAALLGAAVGSVDTARLDIARLAALFDPCVGFRVECREASYA